MPGSMVIKWAHRLLTSVLLVMVAGFFIINYASESAPADEVFSSKKISNDMTIVITKYSGGGATVTDAYRYFLTSKSGDIQSLSGVIPFLVSDTGEAKISGSGHEVSINLSGRVFSFTNSALYYADGVAVIPKITLIATRTQ